MYACLILQALRSQKRTRGGGIVQRRGGVLLIIAVRNPPTCRSTVCSMLGPTLTHARLILQELRIRRRTLHAHLLQNDLG